MTQRMAYLKMKRADGTELLSMLFAVPSSCSYLRLECDDSIVAWSAPPGLQIAGDFILEISHVPQEEGEEKA